jgi:hypothetical protein
MQLTPPRFKEQTHPRCHAHLPLLVITKPKGSIWRADRCFPRLGRLSICTTSFPAFLPSGLNGLLGGPDILTRSLDPVAQFVDVFSPFA